MPEENQLETISKAKAIMILSGIRNTEESRIDRILMHQIIKAALYADKLSEVYYPEIFVTSEQKKVFEKYSKTN